MIRQVYIVSFVFLSLLSQSFAQDFEKDMSQLSAQLDNAENIHIAVDVKVYSDKHKSKLVHQTNGVVKKKGKKVLYEMNNSMICFNETHSILVHKPSKKIIVGKNSKEKRAEMEGQFDLSSIDSLLVNNESKTTYMGENGGSKHYRMTYSKGTYRAVDIFLDSRHNGLKKVIYQYNVEAYPENNYVEIVYNTFDVNAQLSDQLFSNTSYFKQSKKQLQPSAALSGYQVVKNEEY